MLEEIVEGFLIYDFRFLIYLSEFGNSNQKNRFLNIF